MPKCLESFEWAVALYTHAALQLDVYCTVKITLFKKFGI